MKKVGIKGLGLWALVFFLFLNGCAAFPSNRIPRIGALPQPSDGSARVNTSLEFSSGYEMKMRLRKPNTEISRQYFEDEFASVLRDSGYFTMLESGQEGDLRMNVDMTIYLENPDLAVFRLLILGLGTLYTIPSWITHQYKVTVKVTNEQEREHKYVLDDGMVNVIWLPAIIVAPFKSMGRVSTQVRKNMYKDLILRMQKDGILPPAQKAL